MQDNFRIIIAGGKTGGHLFPGISVAQALQRLNRKTRVLFVGTDTFFETSTLKKYGFEHKSIISRPVKGSSIVNRIFSSCLILLSLIQSFIIIRKFKPDFVLGVGGFSSFAVVLSAGILRIPTGIQEQNSVPGLTNRLLAGFSDNIFTSFKDTKEFGKHIKKIKYTGNPVRKFPQTDKKTISDGPEKFTVLVTGGSQGARSINETFIKAVGLMEDTSDMRIIHQTGIHDEKIIRDKYRDLKIESLVKAFFHNMPDLQDIADLAITRAGAGTISEIVNKGLPCILVPFPFAADDHQTSNAKALEEPGGAVMIPERDLSGEVLKKTISALKENRKKLASMTEILKSLATPDADEKIAKHILKTKDRKV